MPVLLFLHNLNHCAEMKVAVGVAQFHQEPACNVIFVSHIYLVGRMDSRFLDIALLESPQRIATFPPDKRGLDSNS